MSDLVPPAAGVLRRAALRAEGLADGIWFRLRLVKMALGRLDRVPVQVVMALETPEPSASWLDPERGCGDEDFMAVR